MSFFDWMIVIGLNGGIIAYGLYLARGVRSSTDWFLAGRSLPWWIVGLSMYATAIDASDLIADLRWHLHHRVPLFRLQHGRNRRRMGASRLFHFPAHVPRGHVYQRRVSGNTLRSVRQGPMRLHPGPIPHPRPRRHGRVALLDSERGLRMGPNTGHGDRRRHRHLCQHLHGVRGSALGVDKRRFTVRRHDRRGPGHLVHRM